MTFLIEVRKTGVRITANGRRIIDWKGDFARCSLDGDWSVPEPNTLLLGVDHGVIVFTKVELVARLGFGRRLR